MRGLSFSSSLLVVLATFSSVQAIPSNARPRSKDYYARSHSLGESYQFDSREWHSVNVSDTVVKHNEKTLNNRGSKDTLSGSAAHLLNDAWNGLKGIGGSSTVKITWYTGHDLLNPSCWADGSWHPTDDSMASALTLSGWDDQPKCFKFMELCNGPSKCVFVRKVDTCAGCAPGSHHVDLTKAAFSELASLDEGTLNVQMRTATEPDQWFEDLWGPKK